MHRIRIPPITLTKSRVRMPVPVNSDLLVALFSFFSARMPKIRGRIVHHPTIIPIMTKILAAVFIKNILLYVLYISRPQPSCKSILPRSAKNVNC